MSAARARRARARRAGPRLAGGRSGLRCLVAGVLAGALGLAFARSAAADPTIWELARDPGAAARFEAIDLADSLLHKLRQLRADGAPSSIRAALGRDARILLDGVRAGEAREPALRYRYGSVLSELYEAMHDDRALTLATDHFRFVTQSQAPVLLRAEAWNDLAIAEARLGHLSAELAAYDEGLRLEVHPETRAVLLANRAEALMYQGKMSAAVAGYRSALATMPVYAYPSMAASTHWGLAVALDRLGDLRESFEQIDLARGLDAADEAIKSATWFYVPAYDVHWYAALGYWHHAKHATDVVERVRLYEDAVTSWTRYLDIAPPTDRWLGLAAERRKQCDRELAHAVVERDEATRAERERIQELLRTE